MQKKNYVQEILDIIRSGLPQAELAEKLSDYHENDLADALTALTPEERQKMTELLNSGFVDSFRKLYPDAEGIYSWWSYRFKAREKNAGWRIDYFFVSEELAPAIRDAWIENNVYGSDHCPVGLELAIA